MIKERLNQLYESCTRKEYCGIDLFGNELYRKIRYTTTPEGMSFIEAVNEIAKNENINLNCIKKIIYGGDFNIVVIAVAWCEGSMQPEQLVFTFSGS